MHGITSHLVETRQHVCHSRVLNLPPREAGFAIVRLPTRPFQNLVGLKCSGFRLNVDFDVTLQRKSAPHRLPIGIMSNFVKRFRASQQSRSQRQS